MSVHLIPLDTPDRDLLGRTVVGGKAGVLAELSAAGFDVPHGFVVTADALANPALTEELVVAARRSGAQRFAVRSSGFAEDTEQASYAGLYETFLDVPPEQLEQAVRRCFAAAGAERVQDYQHGDGVDSAAMAVLVQVMIDPVAAGVAFTADPVTGDRNATVVTAVAGLGAPLVSGETIGEQWTITTRTAVMSRPGSGPRPALTAAQAAAVAALARQIADRYRCPQDVEWAFDRCGRLRLLQARPMTALGDPVVWAPPGPGLWMRNFRLGEWLPEAVTPLFATWLLPALEDSYLDGMHACLGIRVPFRYALVNGWYYNATPIPSPALLARVLVHGRGRALRILYNALVRVGRDPASADEAALSALHRQWREQQLPRYRQLVGAATAEAGTAGPRRLAALVDELAHEAGIHLWYLAIVGGSAWKMEACLTRFVRRHLAGVLPDGEGCAQVLLRGLPDGLQPLAPHAVQSIDWYHRLAGDLAPTGPADPESGAGRQAELLAQRTAAERPRLLARFHRLLHVNQRYAMIRERQAHDLTLGWPVLRTCARRLGRHLTERSIIDDPDDLFFCTRTEVQEALTGPAPSLTPRVGARRAAWRRQRRLAAPLTLGRPPRLIGDVIGSAVQQARGAAVLRDGVIVGHPASTGRATGPVCLVNGMADFAAFHRGDVLVAKATAPAWTPLFARAAAIVTDGGSLAAHASLIAREYGIPAVVGTGDATHRLTPGCLVTVDGTAGTVTVHEP
jgi:phosphohistidine swiveling domain-containing protein